jgi:hypothetical protein
VSTTRKGHKGAVRGRTVEGDRRGGAREALGRGGLSLRPFEPGRAEPPVPILDDLERFVAPPLRGKAHPPGDMDGAKPTLDDEQRRYHHHPNDAGSTEFGYDPEAADAAADLAGDMGQSFLEGATRGDDVSDIVAMASDAAEDELPLLLEEMEGPGDEDEDF